MSTVDDLTIAYQEGEITVVKELDKVILSKGAWVTILFRYQDWVPSKEAYSEEKYSIRRYKKSGDRYLQQSKFNISSREQAQKIVDALNQWIGSAE
jgi:hypothetical protein